MEIYYTTQEGGIIRKMHLTISRIKAVRLLKKNRIKNSEGYFSSLLGHTVHSVFFTNNKGKVKRIWDASHFKFRPRSARRGMNLSYIK